MKELVRKFAVLLPILSGVMWGATGTFVRNLTDYGMDTYTVIGVRAVPGALILTTGIFIYDRSLLKIRFRDFWIFAVAALTGTLGLNLCYNFSIGSLTLSLAAVLLGMAPVFVLIFAAVIFHERITLRKAGCMIAAIAGCVLVSGVLEEAAGMNCSVRGILTGVLSALCYAVYSIMSKLALNRGYRALTVTCYSLLINGICILFGMDWGVTREFVAESPVSRLLYIALYSVCISVLPYVLYTMSFSFMDAGKVSILASGEPVAAMIFGIIFFSEIPTPLMAAGMLTAVSAIVILGLPDKDKKGKL